MTVNSNKRGSYINLLIYITNNLAIASTLAVKIFVDNIGLLIFS